MTQKRFIKDRSPILLISNEDNKDVYSFVHAKRNNFNWINRMKELPKIVALG